MLFLLSKTPVNTNRSLEFSPGGDNKLISHTRFCLSFDKLEIDITKITKLYQIKISGQVL